MFASLSRGIKVDGIQIAIIRLKLDGGPLLHYENGGGRREEEGERTNQAVNTNGVLIDKLR